MTVLYLIRHGITEANLQHLYCGSTDIPLCKEGRKELQKLAETEVYPRAEYYCTSGMLRTEETLKALYGDIPHDIIPELRETNFGIFEMKSYEQMKDCYEYRKWITGDMERSGPPGGESNSEVIIRCRTAAEQLAAMGGNIVCITHGGVIAALMSEWFHESNRYKVTPAPGCGYAVTFEDIRPISFMPVP